MAAEFFGGVFGAVFVHFGGDGLGEVEVHGVGQRDAVHEDVAEFLADGLAEGGVGGAAAGGLLGGEPLEEFEEFAGLDGDAGGEVAGLVVFVPLAFIKEFVHEVAEPLEGDAVVAEGVGRKGIFSPVLAAGSAKRQAPMRASRRKNDTTGGTRRARKGWLGGGFGGGHFLSPHFCGLICRSEREALYYLALRPDALIV